MATRSPLNFLKVTPPAVNLALQGGGAHGAFTWGVLDALLEDGRIGIGAISGTSAGAMNAVVLADGLRRGGVEVARQALADFWYGVGKSMPFDPLVSANNGDSAALAPLMKLLIHWTHFLSPYQWNPLNLNPLRDVLTARVDFEALRQSPPVPLFIATTHANSGRLRLFREWELTAETVLASACLPTLQHAIVIEGQAYWDGGYAANPAVLPLVFDCPSHDTLLVLLSPLEYDQTPRSAEEIHGRALELAFSASFLREMAFLARIQSAARQSWLPLGRLERRVARNRFHLLEARELTRQFSPATKVAAHVPFLEMLRDLGRNQAQEWMSRHRADVGRRSTFDLNTYFA